MDLLEECFEKISSWNLQTIQLRYHVKCYQILFMVDMVEVVCMHTHTNTHTQNITKIARQRFFFLRRLRRLNIYSRILCSFYRFTVQSILFGYITAWYGSCTSINHKALQRVVKTAQHITRAKLASIKDLYTQWFRKRANRIFKDPNQTSHKLFYLLLPGRQCSRIQSCTTRLCDSFVPQAITVNS